MLRLIPMRDLPGIVGLSRAKIYELMKNGEFIPATFLTPHRSAFRSDLLEEWINSRPFVTSKDEKG